MEMPQTSILQFVWPMKLSRILCLILCLDQYFFNFLVYIMSKCVYHHGLFLQWDDSIDEEPSNQRNRFHLPSPKRKAVSPLKNQDVTKLARRRKKKKWSLEEEDALRKGVEQYVILLRKTFEKSRLLIHLSLIYSI